LPDTPRHPDTTVRRAGDARFTPVAQRKKNFLTRSAIAGHDLRKERNAAARKTGMASVP
jgi:hypothetical protein